jgi:hypothetical protein
MLPGGGGEETFPYIKNRYTFSECRQKSLKITDDILMITVIGVVILKLLVMLFYKMFSVLPINSCSTELAIPMELNL